MFGRAGVAPLGVKFIALDVKSGSLCREPVCLADRGCRLSHDIEPPRGQVNHSTTIDWSPEPSHSTGLKIYGESEWLDQKRGIHSPQRWHKLHLGVDADTHEVVAVELTQDDVGDVSELVGLLDQVQPGSHR